MLDSAEESESFILRTEPLNRAQRRRRTPPREFVMYGEKISGWRLLPEPKKRRQAQFAMDSRNDARFLVELAQHEAMSAHHAKASERLTEPDVYRVLVAQLVADRRLPILVHPAQDVKRSPASPNSPNYCSAFDSNSWSGGALHR